MRVPNLEEMVQEVEQAISYTSPRIGQLSLLKLMVSNHLPSGTLYKHEFQRLVGLALNADGSNANRPWEERRTAQETISNTILSHYIVTEEDARIAKDRDRQGHIRVQGVLDAIQEEIAGAG